MGGVKQQNLYYTYRILVARGLRSRKDVLSCNLQDLRGIGPVAEALIKEAAETYSDAEWATTFPLLSGVIQKPSLTDEKLKNKYQAHLLLDERLRYILDMKWGLWDGTRHTLNAIAEKLELSRGRVQQLYRGAIRTLEQLARKEAEGLPLTGKAEYDLDTYRFILDD